MHKNKKIVISTLVMLTMLSQSFSGWLYIDSVQAANNTTAQQTNSWLTNKLQDGVDLISDKLITQATAAGAKEEDKLVAIFVDSALYESIKGDIERYAVEYIQKNFWRTKALVMPVDITTIKPLDIQKILSNLYHGWQKETPATLIGTVLIWNIPLPTIQTTTDWRKQKSILPYTDLEKPFYIYNGTDWIFVPSPTPSDSQQELFHGLIVFQTTDAYTQYFKKLRTYLRDPHEWSKRVWYEDFVQAKKNYTESNLNSYLKSQLFEEDLTYHRYTSVLFDILQEESTDNALDILSEEIKTDDILSTNESSSEFQSIESAYNDILSERSDELSSQVEENREEVKSTAKSDIIPTIFLGQSIKEQLKNYLDLFSPEYGDIMHTQIQADWRWVWPDIDNSINKITTFDYATPVILYNVGALFEKKLDQTINNSHYALRIPIPIKKEEYTCVLGKVVPLTNPKISEAFYFGKNALDITGAMQTTRYRWTYGNLETATEALNQTRVDSWKSVGATYNITDQQIFASRWYNIMLTQPDADIFEGEADDWVCKRDIRKDAKRGDPIVKDFTEKYWWGNSPLNLIGDGPMYLETNNWQNAYNPSKRRSVWGPLFDIAWSTPAKQESIPWTNASSATTFWYFHRTEEGWKTIDRCDNNYKGTLASNYFNIVKNTTDYDVQVIKQDTNWSFTYINTPTCKTRVIYKTIDSVVKHASPTPEEVNQMNITTPSRGIDSDTYVSFTSLAGNNITLEYPNIYDIPVYEQSGGKMILSKPWKIKENIVTYLQDTVKEYNEKLVAENSKIAAYVSSNQQWLDKLRSIDFYAAPGSRNYVPLPENFYVDLLTDEMLTKLADILYIKNTPWNIRNSVNNVWDALDWNTTSANLDTKIGIVMDYYLKDPVQAPIAWEPGWYEVAYIRSDWADSVVQNSTIPGEIQSIIAQKDQTKLAQKTASTWSDVETQKQTIDASCNVWSDWTVPLLQRWGALKCWWNELKKLTVKGMIKISYDNAEWPVYTLDQFKGVLETSYKDYVSYVRETLQGWDSKVAAGAPDSSIDPVSLSPEEQARLNEVTVGSVSIDTIGQRILTNAMTPISIWALNKNQNAINYLTDTITVTTDNGYFPEASYNDQLAQEIKVDNLDEPILFIPQTDQSEQNITIKATIWEWTGAITSTKQLTVAKWELSIYIQNNEVKDGEEQTIKLLHDWYINTTLKIPVVYENRVPTLQLTLKDSAGNPLHNLVEVTTEKWLIEPCYIESSSTAGQQCVQQNLRDIQWSVTIKLLPSTKAWTDILRIAIPWLPTQEIPITVLPSDPYSVDVEISTNESDLLPTWNAVGKCTLKDIWGNKIIEPTEVDYNLIGALSDKDGNTEGSILVEWGEAKIPLFFSDEWGTNYMSAEITNKSTNNPQGGGGTQGNNGTQIKTIPWYTSINTPKTLWPQTYLNVTYLTLLGKDWGNIDTNWYTVPDLIFNSKKLLAVTTSIWAQDNEEPYDLRPLRSYWGWQSLGESRRHTFDPNIINYGDPMLQHWQALLNQDDAGAELSETVIAANINKTIKKSLEFDIDKDGKKDLLILYSDDTLEFMKNYGGSPAYRKLGDIMNIVDGVDDMWVGDTDWDKMDDIIIRTKANTLRAYQNKWWVFSTNGTPICLAVPFGDKNLDWVYDIAIEDMDNDGSIDIVTNDMLWDIKVFYGWWGKKEWGANYISADWFSCDTNRQSRQTQVTKIANFWLTLNSTPTFDDSLLRWSWLNVPSTEEMNEQAEAMGAMLAEYLPKENDPANFDLSALLEVGAEELIRYQNSPYGKLPIYEDQNNPTLLSNIAYIPVRYLDAEKDDPAISYKTYTVGENNTVTVTVYIQWLDRQTTTYIESLRWPWIIDRTITGSVVWFNRWTLPSSATIDWNIENGYLFVVDNIPVNAWSNIQFSYTVSYTPPKIMNITVEDLNKDWFLDINTLPVDTCSTSKVFFATQASSPRTYQKNIEKIIIPEWDDDATTELGKEILKQAEAGDVENLPWMNSILEKRDTNENMWSNLWSLLEWWINESFELNIDSFLGDKWVEFLDDVERGVSTLLEWACKWFVSGDGKGWLPVPFNVALLAPGDINLFWCKIFEDKWLPIFAAPTAGLIPIWPPNPAQAGWWFGGASSISQIRFYVAPTLTQSVGIAMCLGPYGVGFNLPAPLKSIAWNCIVFAARPWSNNAWDKIQGAIADNNNWNRRGDEESGVWSACRTAATSDPNKPISPFSYWVKDGSSNIWEAIVNNFTTATQNLGDMDSWRVATWQDVNGSATVSDWLYLWVLDVDMEPVSKNNWFAYTPDDKLIGWKPVQLKIEWWGVWGLIKCIIQKWLDNQIRYVINNMTAMTITVTMPDISGMTDWMENLDFEKLKADLAEPFTKTESWPSPAGQALQNLVTRTDGEMLPAGQNEVSELSMITSNPFNALGAWFEGIPLISVSSKNVTVQVPFIYDENLTKYAAQLESYEKQIKDKIEERDLFIKDIRNKCSLAETPNQQQRCQDQLASYIQVRTQLAKLQSTIKENLYTLQEYKQFPAALKERVNVSDRYISEIMGTLNNITTDLTSWLNVNATRFSAYVDSIILLIGAIKSWQAMIDFSVDWKSKCGKCTVDTYDYYSCSLWLLCPKLPILAIPPFKIPNLYIDLSDIQLGMDVMIPNVRFVPKMVDLPDLPDLPAVPGFHIPTVDANLSINVPSIPQLPKPPVLPELPSFIPTIDLNLPVLPPAPRIPNLAPSIQATLKVMSKVGKILCLVKWNIGLVGEGDVKTRIEQLTQRTWSVEPFDSLKVTKTQPPLRGFDIEVSSHLNFQLHFAWLYNIVDNLAKEINKTSSRFITRANDQTSSAEQSMQEWIDKAWDIIDNSMGWSVQDIWIDANIDIGWWWDGSNIGWFISKLFSPNQNIPFPENDAESVEPNTLRENLQNEITAFKQSEFAITYQKEIDAIQSILDADTTVTPDYDSIQEASNTLQELFASVRSDLQERKQDLENYDLFLDKINTANLINNRSIEGTISTSLYKINEETSSIMENAEHPTKSYLDLEEKLTDWYLNALETRSANDLQIQPWTHNQLTQFFKNTKQDIQTLRKILKTEEKDDISQNKSTTQLTTTQSVNLITPTPTEEVENTAKRLFWTTAVYAAEPRTNNIWRDKNHVYTNQKKIIESKKTVKTVYSRYYLFPTTQYYRNLLEKADMDGFINVFWSNFSIAAQTQPITTLMVNWQSNSSAKIEWVNTNQNIYLIRLNNNITHSHENSDQKKIIILHAPGIDIDNTYLNITWLPATRLKDIRPEDNIELMELPAQTTQADVLTVTLRLPDPIWSYIQIAQWKISPRETLEWMSIQKTSPWSAQETLGSQIWGDSTGPTINVEIIDAKTGETIWEWTNNTLSCNWEYEVKVMREDDWEVIKNTWQQEWKDQVITNNWNTSTITNIKPTCGDNWNTFTLTAEDQAWNEASAIVVLNYTMPSLTITDTPKETQWYNVNTELSTPYPNWFIRFFNIRNGVTSLLTGTTNNTTQTDFPTRILDTNTTWWVFTDADTISLYSDANEVVAKIDKESGKITPSTQRQNRLYISVDTSSNIPVLLLIDKDTGKLLFSLYLKARQLVEIKWDNLIALWTEHVWNFVWGMCWQDEKEVCRIYTTKEWNIYIPDDIKVRVWGAYNYDWGVNYKITLDGKDIFAIKFIPEYIH